MNMKFEEYYDKVTGCFIGKNIGGTLGAPFECYRGEYDISWFMQDISEPIPNDDLDLQLVWLRAVEIEGAKIDSHVLAEYWNLYISATLSEYGTGKNNFNMGIVPPLSGHMRNVNRDSNGAWIRTEIWACLSAGNPALAANYAYYDSCVDHSGEGVYAAVFCAAVQSAAFFEKDILRLSEIGLSYIPQDCAVAKAVHCAIDCYRSGKTWREARKILFGLVPSSFGNIAGYWQGTKEVPACPACPAQEPEPDIPAAEHGFDAPWSMGAVMIGLLYGEGDFGRSVCLTVNLGEDTDCTAGAVGSILGIIRGASAIPEKWRNACSDKIATWTLRIDQNLRLPKTISELSYRIARQTPNVLGSRCELFSFGCGEEFDAKAPQNYYEIIPTAHFEYTPRQFPPHVQEDAKELIAEQGKTVRRHFGLYTLLTEYDATLAAVKKGETKRLKLTFLNMQFTPQYLTVRILDLPEGWTVSTGKEFCVGLEHWHGSHNENRVTLEITPAEMTKGSYTLILEISTNGRMTKNYLPITLINGAC
ncbi:MAG: hypothetical protein HFE26_02345 [Clostridia bacterium]|nr:hypothetical protein [Clostridia bacterium]